MMQSKLLPRAVALLLIPLSIVLFTLLAQVSEAHAATRLMSDARTPMDAPADDPHIAQGGVISTIQSVINYVVNATVFFPARTFQEAIEKATRNIFSEQLDQFREPLEQVVAVYAFQNGAVFGSLAIPGEVNAIGARLTEAAVPVWVLSLVLMGLSVLTRNAVSMGHGMAEVAAELARWLFIALASGNAIAIVNLVHTGFGALTYAIASEGGTVTAGQFVAAFIPNEATFGAWPILLLVIGCVLGLIVILVLSATYIARYVVLLAITGLAPICIACEGIPFTRFVFRDWLSMFLRLEFLQIINIAVLIVFKAMALGAGGSGVAQALLRLAIMIGLASAIIGINLSIFKQVFGVAIDVVAQMRQAAEQIVRVIGMAIGAAVTGGAAVPALAGASGAATVSSAPNASSSAPSGEPTTSTDANHAAAVGASGRTAWALSGAVGGAAGAFMRGYGDGAFAASDFNARRAGAAKAEEMQRAAEMRRAESLAREMGATNSDDIEAIAHSVTEPEGGHTSEQMMRAHRDNAPALREMAQHYGGPARAAAIGGYGNFGDMAIAMAHERLREDATSEASRQSSPTQPAIQASSAAPAISTSAMAGEQAKTDDSTQAVGMRPAADAHIRPETNRDAMPASSNGTTTQTAINANSSVTTSAPASTSSPSVDAGSATTMPTQSDASDGLRVDTNQSSTSSTQPALVNLETPAATFPPAPISNVPDATSPAPSSVNTDVQGVTQSQQFPASSQTTNTSSDVAGDGLQINSTPAAPSPPLVTAGTNSEPPAVTSLMPNGNGAVSINTNLPAHDTLLPSSPVIETASPGFTSASSEPAPSAWSPEPATPPLPRDTPLADWAASVPPSPIRDWIHTPPHIGSPGEQSILTYDFGMGAMLARTTDSSPTHAPLWAQTAYSLRMAYGESYVTHLLQEAQSANWSENELMSRVEQHVEATPSPRVVSLFWKPGDAALSQSHGQRGRTTS